MLGSQAPTFQASSIQVSASHRVTARKPQVLLHTPWCCYTCSYRKVVFLFVFVFIFVLVCLFVWLFLTAQAQLTWTGILNTCWELALHEHHTYQWPHPCCLPGSMDCTLEGTPGFHTAPGMCTGCSPVLHPVTTPTFPTVHFSHLFKTLLAACRNTQCSATCE